MKKVVFIAVLILAALTCKSQLLKEYNIQFDITELTGTDTTLYAYDGNELIMRGHNATIEVIYTSLDDSAAVEFGNTIGGAYNTLISEFICDPVDTVVTTGIYKGSEVGGTAAKLWINVDVAYGYMPIKITKHAATSGTLYIYIRNYE